MADIVSKEISDMYSEMCIDMSSIFHKYEAIFDTNRECEYWLMQALYSVSVKKRLLNRKGDLK